MGNPSEPVQTTEKISKEEYSMAQRVVNYFDGGEEDLEQFMDQNNLVVEDSE